MEPDNKIKVPSHKKTILVIVLIVAGTTFGIWLLVKNYRSEIISTMPNSESGVVALQKPTIPEIPRELSAEEKLQIEERVKALQTMVLSKNEILAIEQRTQEPNGYTPLTSEDMRYIEARYLNK